MHEVQVSPPLEPEPEPEQAIANHDIEPRVLIVNSTIKTICSTIDKITQDVSNRSTMHSTNYRQRRNLSTETIKEAASAPYASSEQIALADALRDVAQIPLADIYGDVRFTFIKFSHDLGHKALSSLLASEDRDSRIAEIQVDAFKKIDDDGSQQAVTTHYLMRRDKQDNYTLEKMIHSSPGGEDSVFLTDEEARTVLAVVREVAGPEPDVSTIPTGSVSVA